MPLRWRGQRPPHSSHAEEKTSDKEGLAICKTIYTIASAPEHSGCIGYVEQTAGRMRVFETMSSCRGAAVLQEVVFRYVDMPLGVLHWGAVIPEESRTVWHVDSTLNVLVCCLHNVADEVIVLVLGSSGCGPSTVS
jgi:hypothetical protein